MHQNLLLEAQHLQKYYGTVHSVEDVSLQVQQGEIFGFLGPNGAGKSTTIGMLLGLIYPTAGKIFLMGQEITPLHTRPLRQVGALVEFPAFMPDLSARANLKQLSILYPHLPTAHVDRTLEMVGLNPADKKKARHFSTGMKQRLGVAIALFNQPRLLILDEPTNGLDPAGIYELRALLHSLKEQGITIILSSHLLHEVELICDRIAVMQHGRVLTQRSIKDLTSQATETIRLTFAQPERALPVLRQHGRLRIVQVADQSIEVEGITSEEAIIYLVQHQLVPHEVHIVRPDLESIFLQLTEQARS
ncbi:putative ABC transporter ATP-binding protein YhcH [Dictyobacter sp. S3.2.2.5]|uniref:ABC transporter ATP-binding protein YhcH n=1 Tax=Dictyobacter halimunensis TaxID=3026934 RepID=A0ABQ6FK24_9CHLR|nr:putative ABC transporter ATP-binding protein YhcH [Dictyobacter sp. S3.2.2.5]